VLLTLRIDAAQSADAVSRVPGFLAFEESVALIFGGMLRILYMVGGKEMRLVDLHFWPKNGVRSKEMRLVRGSEVKKCA